MKKAASICNKTIKPLLDKAVFYLLAAAFRQFNLLVMPAHLAHRTTPERLNFVMDRAGGEGLG